MSGRRAELRAEAMRLRQEEGLTIRQIAERMGKSRGTVGAYFSDPDGAKARALKDSYRGSCSDCGMPTDGGNGRDKAPGRCIYCVQGRERPPSAKPRLCVPVRLSEIKVDVRLEAALEAARIYRETNERQELLFAAISPSDQVYWIAESARPILAQVAA